MQNSSSLPISGYPDSSIASKSHNVTSMCMTMVGMVLVSVIVGVIWKVVRCIWWRPLMLERAMRRQGMQGPAPLFMIGNYVEIMKLEEMELATDMGGLRHDILQRMLPYYTKWSKTYGEKFVFWEASEPRIVVTEPELIREVFSAKCALAYGKSFIHQRCCEHFLGKGVVMANGESWARQRRIIAPAFHIDKLKGLAGVMTKCTEQLISKWGEMVGDMKQVEVDVASDLRMLTADIIACTEFGSSYEQGKRIFDLLTSLQKLTLQFAHFVWLPGSRFLPTSWNWEIWRLKREMENLLKEIIQERRDLVSVGKIGSYGKDLLGLMLAESEGKFCDLDDVNCNNTNGNSANNQNNLKSQFKPKFTTQQIMDECKTFFFAGHETTAGLLTWSMLLLAANPEWQEKAREEVFDVLGEKGDNLPEAETLHKLKILGMIINETLRLYPPAIVITRYALMDMKLGDMFIPKGSSVWIPVLAMHLDQELWGEDASQFKPQRFEQGIARACKHPLAYMPFAFGPRNCVGQTFALMEAKIVLSMILRKYRFTLAPSYRHAPVTMLTLKPKHGAQVILQKIL
ncbi:hypothetical protein L7F22_045696 [Adiantum nelumboides]|nr:hypothetical protein [Adiantum nelumboides]